MTKQTIEELREEFKEEYGRITDGATQLSSGQTLYIRDQISDWWLSKFQSYKEGIIEEVEALKRHYSTSQGFMETELNNSYNQALKKIIELLNK